MKTTQNQLCFGGIFTWEVFFLLWEQHSVRQQFVALLMVMTRTDVHMY